jgi:hypothetical protein
LIFRASLRNDVLNWCTFTQLAVSFRSSHFVNFARLAQVTHNSFHLRYNMTRSLAAKGVLGAALFACLVPCMVTAQDVVNSPHVVTGTTGAVHILPTTEITEQIEAQRGPVVAPGVLSYHGAQS